MDRMNYHHLRYFHEVATVGNLTLAASRLNVSQSALSTQIRQLEERLGYPLFERAGRRLVLTEAGGIALDHAARIFQAGDELVAALEQRGGAVRPLRLGAQSTLSRNFQLRFLRPIIAAGEVDLILSSGNNAALLDALQALALDIVLTTEAPPRDRFADLIAHRIAGQPVGLYAVPGRLGHASLKEVLVHEPMILPTESSIRTGFDSLVARLEVTPRIAAEVDDMAMIRLLAREGVGVAAAPAVVLADEIEQGIVHAAPFPLDIAESFYAIVARRSFPPPSIAPLLEATDAGRSGSEPGAAD
ncbi:LysR family transcriptional regulator [Thalassobaculum salexigens]|uniref:LysR family transcriptional regulator n=1 Tax=Thalassobaculum salexigens TaxID=455360 RepID=UPI0004084427|nr:LysR family transcriptional regulator [Thalassobaculum salexigens]